VQAHLAAITMPCSSEPLQMHVHRYL